jgi:DNA-directed RNA polymerase subunit L
MFLLFLLTREVASKKSEGKYVEIGSKYGWSTVVQLTALREYPRVLFEAYEVKRETKGTLKRRIRSVHPKCKVKVRIEDGLKRVVDKYEDHTIEQLFIDADHTFAFGRRIFESGILTKLSRHGSLHFHDFHLFPEYTREDEKFGESYAIAEWYDRNRETLEKEFLCAYAGCFLSPQDFHYRRIYDLRSPDEVRRGENFFTKSGIEEKFWLPDFFGDVFKVRNESGYRNMLAGSLWIVSRDLLSL